jgi:hypothetical protein
MMKGYLLLIALLSMAAAGLAQTQEVSLEASMDNTIFEEGDLSNGAGVYLFTGVTKLNEKRRALIKFDLAEAVPVGVSVDSAMLILTPSKVKTGGTEVAIHKLTTDWGEGTSDADNEEGKGAPATQDDATWSIARVGGDQWIKPGGDFELENSATAIVNLGSEVVFQSETLTQDVNSWLTTPSGNHGWIVIGDESASSTAIRFQSRENADQEARPTLKIYFREAVSGIPSRSDGQELNIYHGPTMGSLVVKSDLEVGECSIDIFSITGSTAFSGLFRLGIGENAIETGIDQPGLYIYRIRSTGYQGSGKIMVSGQ